MSTLEAHYQARYDGAEEGGKLLQSDLKMLEPQAFVDAYGAAHEAQYGTRPPLPSFTPQAVKIEDRPAAQMVQAIGGDEQNTPRRYAAAALEGVLMGGMEINRTAGELVDVAAKHSDLLNVLVHPFGGEAGPDAPPAALLPDKSMSESVVGAIAQFTAPYLVAVKTMEGLQMFKAAGVASPWKKLGLEIAKDGAASLPVDFAAFDPQSNNVIDAANEVAKKFGFKGQFMSFLKSTPGDVDVETQLENRVKAAVTNLPLNAALGFTVSKLKDGAVAAFMASAKAARTLAHAGDKEFTFASINKGEIPKGFKAEVDRRFAEQRDFGEQRGFKSEADRRLAEKRNFGSQRELDASRALEVFSSKYGLTDAELEQISTAFEALKARKK